MTDNGNGNGNGNGRAIKVYLRCPSLTKLMIHYVVVHEEQKLDFGSIGENFGLDPLTVKLNGHLISKGFDFISSTVTWRSLLSFFSSRGFPIGEDDNKPIVVEGRVGGYCCNKDEDHELIKINKRLRDCEVGCSSQPKSTTWEERSQPGYSKCSNGHGFKRKVLFEDLSLLKKLKINDYDPDIPPSGRSNVVRNPVACCHSSVKGKRTRDDEVIVSSSCKRIK
ncbi:hypothetical protein ACFE04_001204 [Oxalis oulophora]